MSGELAKPEIMSKASLSSSDDGSAAVAACIMGTEATAPDGTTIRGAAAREAASAGACGPSVGAKAAASAAQSSARSSEDLCMATMYGRLHHRG